MEKVDCFVRNHLKRQNHIKLVKSNTNQKNAFKDTKISESLCGGNNVSKN